MDPDVLLAIENLSTSFYTPEGVIKAVDGVSFQVKRSKTLGVLGESGCGKSVTALSIMRLIQDPPGRIEGGRILFEDRDLLKVSRKEIRRIRGEEISMIFQEPMSSLNPVYTIGDQIAETVRIHRRAGRGEALERAVEMIRMVGIPSPRRRVREYPHQLSGGMRQRAMIAMAMACRPKLLIADEPTTALDVTIQAQILDLMLDLQEELGMALMMITHDLGVVAEVSDEVLVMYAGQVVEYAEADYIFERPKHPYTIGIMRSVPRPGRKFEEGKQPLKEIPGMVPGLSQLPGGCLFEPRCMSAVDRCKIERPPLFVLAKGEQCRCWLMERDAVSVA